MTNTETSASTPITRQRSRWPLWAGIGLALIVAAIVLFISNPLHIGQKVYAEAAGHKIYKKDIQSLQLVNGQTKNVTDHQAATVLADKYLTEAMAKQQGVAITHADIVAAYGNGIDKQKTTDPYGYQNLVNQLYLTKLDHHNAGVYTGKLLVANFSRYVPYQSGLLPQQEKETPLLGNPAAIAKDKQYAQTFITNLYDQIKAGKITFDQAIQMEHNDPMVGEKSYYSTQQHSGSFNGPLNQIGLLAARSIRGTVTGMKPGQLSKPFVVRVTNSSTDQNSTAESYFLVVRMDKTSGGESNITFQQELAQAKEHFGYRVNV